LFTEVLETVRRDVVRVASDYPLIAEFFFHIQKQPEVERR